MEEGEDGAGPNKTEGAAGQKPEDGTETDGADKKKVSFVRLELIRLLRSKGRRKIRPRVLLVLLILL